MTIALSIPLSLIALWWALRFLPAGADGHRPVPYLLAFARFLWMPSCLIALVALVSRHWPVAVVAVALTVGTGLFASPWYRRWLDRRAPTGNDDRQGHDVASSVEGAEATDAITVMTLNCRYGHAGAEAIVDAVRQRHVSLLALQELTTGLVEELDAAGLSTLLPHRQLGRRSHDDNGGFNGIFTSLPVTAQKDATLGIEAADVPGIIAGGIAFHSAHPKSPMRGCHEWSYGIRALGELAHHFSFVNEPTATDNSGHAPGQAPSQSATAASAPNAPTPAAPATMRATVIMGDLNSNADHPSFRALLRYGLRDAGLTAGHARVSSFPTWLRWPRLELDHILTTPGVAATDAETFVVPGSDHLALAARLRTR
ncbi:endonuclease/exonuclease/phosphatase family protein [Bifidobacterium sp. ESL0763]|uniref:endonuclease/exonuclease/phosphatase family protein n=1 Tax=Bifidobacterium sp. ESL0763 TaxID=2983227 RepID=UPI0023F7A73C|nr:endonuclease/exonuclease/phosphatase family protein [Bifidobacterium sp. ESL0763]MDF7664359.1 endonuclease/exonuclease/phosphatase family protein [Bifidobacterium sp. ESL0763]